MIRRADFDHQGEAAAKERALARHLSDAMQRLRTAAVPIEQLTRSENWDAFLRKCAPMQDADRTEARMITEQLASAEYLTPERVAELRHRLARIQGRIEGREQVMNLPREILTLAHELSAR